MMSPVGERTLATGRIGSIPADSQSSTKPVTCGSCGPVVNGMSLTSAPAKPYLNWRYRRYQPVASYVGSYRQRLERNVITGQTGSVTWVLKRT